MYPAAFEYLEPRTLQEAVELLRQWGEDARILAGGQSLVPLMKLRLARPRYLIDLNRVPGLSYIKEENGRLRIGALTRHAEIEEAKPVREKIPLMQEAVRVLGDLQVRNLGTIGGAIVEADPAGDWGPVILALNARVKCLGLHGEREVEAKDFFTFAYTTALQPDEVVTEVSVPIPSAPRLGTYEKLERVAGDFAIASVAVQIDIDRDGICREIGIGLGGADEKPLKALSVEVLLRGQKISSELLEAGARQLQEIANPIGDLRGSSEYKKEVLAVIFRRALERLIERSRALREK
ncbi:MAG: FAD binding domain-containing protein [Candidatus Binatia bacterium]